MTFEEVYSSLESGSVKDAERIARELAEEKELVDFDGPLTERNPEYFDGPPTERIIRCDPTMPAPYSREAA